MKKTNFVITVIALLSTLQSEAAAKNPIHSKSISEVSSISRRTDGAFDVTCVDNSTEIRSESELNNNLVCMFDTTEINWTLATGGISNGMKFCDLSTRKVEKNNKFISFTAHFIAPCSVAVNSSASCSGASCYVTIENTSYSMNFSNADELNLTRLSDDFKGTFKPIE